MTEEQTNLLEGRKIAVIGTNGEKITIVSAEDVSEITNRSRQWLAQKAEANNLVRVVLPGDTKVYYTLESIIATLSARINAA